MSAVAVLPIRLGLVYAAIGSLIGIQLPYWPLFLTAKGLGAQEIGEVLAVAYCAKLISNPFAGHLADHRGDCRKPILLFAVAGFLATLLFFPASNFLQLFLVTLLTSAATTAFMPLADSMAMLASARKLLDYGRARLWASLAFIASSVLGGMVLVGRDGNLVLLTILGILSLAAIAAWSLPDISIPPAKENRRPIAALLGNKLFLLFLLLTGLIQVSHVVYYGFSTLHWHAAGLSGGTIGLLWAEGVTAEVIAFALGTRLVARFGPVRLMIAGATAGLVRWTVLSMTTDPVLIASVQWLHALTFTSSHLGAVAFMSRAVPAELGARAQALYQSVSNGLIFGLLSPVAGLLFAKFQGLAFLGGTVLSLCGLGCTLLLLRLWRGGNIVATAQ